MEPATPGSTTRRLPGNADGDGEVAVSRDRAVDWVEGTTPDDLPPGPPDSRPGVSTGEPRNPTRPRIPMAARSRDLGRWRPAQSAHVLSVVTVDTVSSRQHELLARMLPPPLVVDVRRGATRRPGALLARPQDRHRGPGRVRARAPASTGDG